MQNITISQTLSRKVDNIKLSCIECDVKMVHVDHNLWNEILQKVAEISRKIGIEDIKDIPAIAASRVAYKSCGKDPARYRLSADALLRRVVNRNEIYQINNVVDLLNLVSISTGFSIGGYDTGKISGDIEFGIGRVNEPYSGIGRGELNIEGLPVFRDNIGAFGTPTSDSDRTSVNLETKRFLMIIIDFGSDGLTLASEMAVRLLLQYANASNIEIKNI